MPESLILRLLGAPVLDNGGGCLSFSRHKSVALLSYLALEPRHHARDSLATLLWPDCGQSRGRANLRSCLFDIDHASSQAVLRIEADTLGLAPSAFRIDVMDFRALGSPCPRHGHDRTCPECQSRLEAAARLWRGGFMAGFSLPDSPGFDDWQLAWGERLGSEHCALLDRLSAGLRDAGRLEEALEYARLWVEAEPFEEEARHRQIKLLLLLGRKAQAVERFEAWAETSLRELGFPPSERTRSLVEVLLPRLDRSQAGRPVPSKAARSPRATAGAGPRAGLIGRDMELEAIGLALVSKGPRVHSIVGTGGLGKTLLARGLLAERGGQFPGGAFFVDLSALRDSGLVAQAIAAALGVAEVSAADHDLAEALGARIGNIRTLVVLDNFEQVMPAVSLVSRLLALAPALVVLATSRESLGLEGESVWELSPLGYPQDGASARPSDCQRYPALALLALRGGEAAPDFELTEENAPACACLCARLDGLPLALELAASRFRMLSPGELLARLDRRLELLALPRGPALERHRTLRAMIDWSYELLDPSEQVLLAMISVFEGSFDLAGAEALGREGAMEGLDSLVAKSLLRRASLEGTPRFSLPESIRAYGAERLALRPDRDDIRQSFARHYLARAEAGGPGFLDPDLANFRSALDLLIAAGDSERAYRLCLAVEWPAYRLGRFAWGECALKAALGLPLQEGTKNLRGRCLRAYGWLRFVQGAWREAHESYLGASVILRAAGDSPGLARCLSDLGVVERWMGNRVAGDARCLEAIDLARGLGALPLAYALIWAYGTTGGRTVDGGQREGLGEAISLARAEGDPWAEAHALESLGDFLRESGSPAEALPCYERALKGFEAVGDEWMRAWTLEGLGMNARRLGGEEALARLRDSLGIFARLGDRSDAVYVMGELGLAVYETKGGGAAAFLLGAYSALGRPNALDKPPGPSPRSPGPKAGGSTSPAPGPAQHLEEAMQEVSTRYPAEWMRGTLMAYEEAIAFSVDEALFFRP